MIRTESIINQGWRLLKNVLKDKSSRAVTNSNMYDALRHLVPFYNLKNVKNLNGGVTLLEKLQAEACNFTKSIASPWVFLMFLTLYKWYQTVQNICEEQA